MKKNRDVRDGRNRREIVLFHNTSITSFTATNSTILEIDNTNNSVKIALGAALGLNNTNNTENIKFLDKVQKVIGKMKNVMGDNKRRNCGGIIHKTFIDFVQESINKLNRFEDSDLEMFFSVFADEVKKYHYRGCKFYELTENHNFRSLFSKLIHEIAVQPINKIRRVLKTVANKLEKKKYNEHEREILETINSLYRHDSSEKFDKFLVNIDGLRMKTRKNIDLVNIVRDGLRTIIFDHYTNLNRNARKALRAQMNEYFKEFTPQSTTKFIDSIKYSKVQKLALTTKKTTTVKEAKRHFKKDIRHDHSENAGNVLKDYTKSSLYLNDERDTNKSSYEHIERAYADTRKYLRNKRKLRRNGSNKISDSQHIAIKPLRTTQRFNAESFPSIKYETDAFEYIMTENKRKKFTFRTLYPKFAHEVIESKPMMTGRRAFYRSTVRIPEYSWEEDNINSSIEKARRLKAKRLTKELETTAKMETKEKQPMRRFNSNCQNSK